MFNGLQVRFGRTLIRWGKRLAPYPAPMATAVPPGVMFSASARHKLEEMLGYERFVLAECGDAIRTEQGKSGPTKIIINDQKPYVFVRSFHDTAGDIGANMVRKMSPLVFTSSHKLIDMVIEWTIRENGFDCPWEFEKKFKLIQKNTSMCFPDFLATDTALRSAVIALYDKLTPFRNAITHNRWGKANQGTLDFDFHRSGKHFKLTMPFQDVLALADCSELIGSMLVDNASDANKIDTVRWLLDALAVFHQQPKFNVTRPRYFQIIRRTVMPESSTLTVDLDEVRECAHKQSIGSSFTFDLTIVADFSPQPIVWRIPSSNLPSDASLSLDENWHAYRVAYAKEELELVGPFFKHESGNASEASTPE